MIGKYFLTQRRREAEAQRAGSDPFPSWLEGSQGGLPSEERRHLRIPPAESPQSFLPEGIRQPTAVEHEAATVPRLVLRDAPQVRKRQNRYLHHRIFHRGREEKDKQDKGGQG